MRGKVIHAAKEAGKVLAILAAGLFILAWLAVVVYLLEKGGPRA